MKFDGYKLKQGMTLIKTAEEYLDDDFEGLIDLFLKYLNDEDIEIYNEDSLKYELGTFLRIILPEYHINFEKNVRYFTHIKDTIKYEIDITIYPKEGNEYNLNDNNIKLIDSEKAYAIELKFPSFKIEAKNNEYVKKYNQGGNQILENLENDMQFVGELIANGFKNAWSVVLVPEISKSIYQFPKNTKRKASEIYYKFRGFDSEGNSLWNEESKINLYQIEWKDWKDKNGINIGKYYIKSGYKIEKA